MDRKDLDRMNEPEPYDIELREIALWKAIDVTEAIVTEHPLPDGSIEPKTTGLMAAIGTISSPAPEAPKRLAMVLKTASWLLNEMEPTT
jgi:hypothetical protein